MRPDVHSRIKKALEKKPTNSQSGSKGLTSEQIQKLYGSPHQNADKIIKNSKSKKKRRPIDTRSHALTYRPDFAINADPRTVIIKTPQWFTSQEPVEVSIIIPMFKSSEVIIKQINTWDLTDDGISKEIIYIDDGCPNKSYLSVIETWENRKHETSGLIGKILLNGNNVGYGRACNVAAKYASGKYLIFLNADAFVTENWVKPIYDRMENDVSIGLVGNLHLKPDGIHIDSAGSEWVWTKGTFEHIGRHSLYRKPTPGAMKLTELPKEFLVPGEREMVTGCCFAVSRHLWNNVLKGFDPNFKIGYWEDSDINMKIHELGYKVWFEPSSVIYHSPGHSGSGGHPFMEHNKRYFYNKWVHSKKIDKFVKDKRPQSKMQIRKIHIRRTGAHGDVLAAASFMKALKAIHPKAKITFFTACADVLLNNPYVDTTVYSSWNDISTPFNSDDCDLIYDLNSVYEYKPTQHLLLAYADYMDLKVSDSELFIKTEPLKNVPLPRGYVVIHAGKTAWAGRNWHSDKFDEIALRLKEMGQPTVLIGTSGDKPLSNVNVDLRGRTNIYQLAWVIQNCQCFVGIDSFPMWIAQTFQKRGVCFFGCVDPTLRLINDKIIPVRAEGLPCIGCHHQQPIPCIGTSNCKTGTLACENDITTDIFWEKVAQVVKM
jgi:GT2 family glycosyltransferase